MGCLYVGLFLSFFFFLLERELNEIRIQEQSVMPNLLEMKCFIDVIVPTVQLK